MATWIRGGGEPLDHTNYNASYRRDDWQSRLPAHSADQISVDSWRQDTQWQGYPTASPLYLPELPPPQRTQTQIRTQTPSPSPSSGLRAWSNASFEAFPVSQQPLARNSFYSLSSSEVTDSATLVNSANTSFSNASTAANATEMDAYHNSTQPWRGRMTPDPASQRHRDRPFERPGSYLPLQQTLPQTLSESRAFLDITPSRSPCPPPADPSPRLLPRPIQTYADWRLEMEELRFANASPVRPASCPTPTPHLQLQSFLARQHHNHNHNHHYHARPSLSQRESQVLRHNHHLRHVTDYMSEDSDMGSDASNDLLHTPHGYHAGSRSSSSNISICSSSSIALPVKRILYMADREASDSVLRCLTSMTKRNPNSQHARILLGIIHPKSAKAEFELDNLALESIFLAANEIFFGQRLTHRVRWGWSDASPSSSPSSGPTASSPAAHAYDNKIIGHTAVREVEGDGFETFILLSTPILKSPKYNRRLLISAFLHELIHCYLFICCGWSARESGGHTAGFRAIADMIDEWAGREHLHLCHVEADLDRFRQVRAAPVSPVLRHEQLLPSSWEPFCGRGELDNDWANHPVRLR